MSTLSNEGCKTHYREKRIFMDAKKGELYQGLNDFDRIYTLGPKGTFSNQAANLVAGSKIEEIKYTTTLPQIALEVEADEKALGVLPIENSTSGVVEPAQDSLVESDVVILYELMLEIGYCLVSYVPLNEIKTFFCHSVAFNQTMRFTAKNMPTADVVYTNSNIHSGEMFLAQPDQRIAAIIPEQVAKSNPLFSSKIVAEKVQDYSKNTTRFFAIKKRPPDFKPDFGSSKTSIYVEFHEDRHSLLFELLREFHVFGVNLCRLESRPSKHQAWTYAFFIDFYNNHRVARCLEELSLLDIGYRLLGSYDLIDQTH